MLINLRVATKLKKKAMLAQVELNSCICYQHTPPFTIPIILVFFCRQHVFVLKKSLFFAVMLSWVYMYIWFYNTYFKKKYNKK